MHIIHDVATRHVTRYQRVIDIQGVMLVNVSTRWDRGGFWGITGGFQVTLGCWDADG